MAKRAFRRRASVSSNSIGGCGASRPGAIARRLWAHTSSRAAFTDHDDQRGTRRARRVNSSQEAISAGSVLSAFAVVFASRDRMGMMIAAFSRLDRAECSVT